MKKIITISESDLKRIVNRVIKENKNNEPVKLNVFTTVDGYINLRNDNPSIKERDESEINRKALDMSGMKLREYISSNAADKETSSNLDSENILRVRIGGKDFKGRPGGVTHVLARVPENFDYDKFKSEVSNINHRITTRSEAERVAKEVGELIQDCIGGSNREENHNMDYGFEDDRDSLIPKIMDLVKPFYEKHGLDNTITFLSDIVDTIEDLGDEAFLGSK